MNCYSTELAGMDQHRSVLHYLQHTSWSGWKRRKVRRGEARREQQGYEKVKVAARRLRRPHFAITTHRHQPAIHGHTRNLANDQEATGQRLGCIFAPRLACACSAVGADMRRTRLPPPDLHSAGLRAHATTPSRSTVQLRCTFHLFFSIFLPLLPLHCSFSHSCINISSHISSQLHFSYVGLYVRSISTPATSKSCLDITDVKMRNMQQRRWKCISRPIVFLHSHGNINSPNTSSHLTESIHALQFLSASSILLLKNFSLILLLSFFFCTNCIWLLT